MHPERGGRGRPPSIRHEGRHALSPALNHDDFSRFDFQMASYFHVAQHVFPAAQAAWNNRQHQRFVKDHGREPESRYEVRPYMQADPAWQVWSSLKRNNMEMNYYNKTGIVARQEEALTKRAKTNGNAKGTLRLNPDLKVPRYLTAVDIHCMPGGYDTDGDGMYAGMVYDNGGFYLAMGGEAGPWNDGAGAADVAVVRSRYPDLKPKRILELGCTIGHSTLPLKMAWPDAEVHAIDACAPVLRYAHARAEDLGVEIHFSQQDAQELDFENESFDLVVSTMFMHEVTQKAIKKVGREIHRVLKPGGVMIHNEQPQYHGQPPGEQFLREWDTFFNNEPMRCAFRDMDLAAWVEDCGFDRDSLIAATAPGAMISDSGEVRTRNDGFWFMISARKDA